jgi:hypothetical protein
MGQLLPPRAPNLPLAPTDYSSAHQEKLTNALRLYFNQLDGSLQQLLRGFNNYGTFYSTVTQTNPVASAVNLVTYNNTSEAFGVDYDPANPSRVRVTMAGVYNFQFSAQLDHTGGGNVDFFIWFRVNGTNIPNSATKVVVAGPNDETVASWNYLTSMAAGDYFELVWSSPNTGARILAEPAAAPVPAIPSVIMTATYAYPADN